LKELVFLKLGGSLITDKSRPETPRTEVIERLAGEVKRALEARPNLSLLLGHGSGSFGHPLAQKHGTAQGAITPADWWGYAQTAAAAARLHRLVADTFLAEGVGVVSIQPSSSALCQDGELISMEVEPLIHLLAVSLVPLLYGDVSLDRKRGSTIISTEQVFSYLVPKLHPARILLASEVRGVYTADPFQDPGAQLIPRITPDELAQLQHQLAGSRGPDVTGGMLGKVRMMCQLVAAEPSLTVRVLSGLEPGLLYRALLHPKLEEGTSICAPTAHICRAIT